MKTKYLIVSAIAIGLLSIGVVSAQMMQNPSDNNMMQGMMGHMSNMNPENIDWMKDHMKQNMNITNEEIDEIISNCPMMR